MSVIGLVPHLTFLPLSPCVSATSVSPSLSLCDVCTRCVQVSLSLSVMCAHVVYRSSPLLFLPIRKYGAKSTLIFHLTIWEPSERLTSFFQFQCQNSHRRTGTGPGYTRCPGFPGGPVVKNPPTNAGDAGDMRHRFNLWVRKIP